jgi:hypothetical protein
LIHGFNHLHGKSMWEWTRSKFNPVISVPTDISIRADLPPMFST